MTNTRILVQEGMKKALKAAQKPSLSKRDVSTILKAVASHDLLEEHGEAGRAALEDMGIL